VRERANRNGGQRQSGRGETAQTDTVTDPYFTVDGVSRSLKAFYRESNSTESTTSYATDSYGAGVGFGVPVSEYDTVRYRADYEHSLMHTSVSTAADTLAYCDDVSSSADCQYGTYKLGVGWSRDTRDRRIFPSDGRLISAGGDLALGGGDSLGEEFNNAPQYYKLRLAYKQYLNLSDWLTFKVSGNAAYARTYGDSTVLPPYERLYAGGVRTLRGYQSNRLFSTPDTLDEYGLPRGGSVRLLGGVEFVIPPPFDLDSKSMRFNAFIDAGNVYNDISDTDTLIDELRMTYGISMNWLTPVGPLVFSYGWPINAKDGDRLESFQFSLGMM